MPAPFAHVIDVERVFELHDIGLKKVGTISSPPDEECIQARLGNAWAAEQYCVEEAHESPGLLFACFLFSYLLKDHCASDGNKRMAWLAFVEVLAHYELDIDASDDEIVGFCELVIKQRLGGNEVAEWLFEKLIQFTPIED